MANTLKFGNGQWATGNGTALAYNDENANFKPLPFDFTRASSGTVVNQSGLIETVGSGIPRIDFQGNTKGALLLEPQRTNLITQSNNLTSSWGAFSFSGGTMSSNYGFLSPDGSNNATRLTYTNTSAGTGGALLTQNLTLVANAVYTISFWAKNVSGQKRIRLDLRNSSSAGVSGTSFELTNEWKKYNHTVTNDNSTARGVQIRIIDSEFAGNRVFDMWGVQLEQAGYATSTIPTSGSAVTRVADACSQTTPDGVIGQTEGTVYWEIDVQTTVATGNENILNIDNGSGFGNTIYLSKSAAGSLVGEMYVSGGLQATFTKTNITKGIHKMAMAYANNNTAFFVDGVQIGVTDTSCTVPLMNRIQLGNGVFGQMIGLSNNVKLYNTRLSNSELTALTQV